MSPSLSPADAKTLGEMLGRLRIDVPASGFLRLPVALASKIEVDGDGCWLWLAHCDRNGYGKAQSGVKSKGMVAHKAVYQILVGQVPEGLTLDHLCRVRNCVNPAHLEPVTLKENVGRGTARCSKITHCPAGHAYDADNTYAYRGARFCRECYRQKGRERRIARRNNHPIAVGVAEAPVPAGEE